jgi:hypothetical protein
MEITDLPDLYFKSLYKERRQPHRKELIFPVAARLSSGCEVIVPAGFITDLATVPRLFWGVIQPSGRHDYAVLVHDYLIEQGTNRRFADKELLYLLECSGVSWIKRILMFSACRIYNEFIRLSFLLN